MGILRLPYLMIIGIVIPAIIRFAELRTVFPLVCI